MKKILVLGVSSESSDAVSNIMASIIKPVGDSKSFVLFGYSEKEKIVTDDCNITRYSVENPFCGRHYFFRFLRKMCYIFKTEDFGIASFYIYNKLKRKFKGQKFDLVVSCSGPFGFTLAAYKFAKKNHFPLRIICFDPFVNNTFSRSERKRKKTEEKWLEYAEYMFYDSDNLKPESDRFNDKRRPFKLPVPEYGIDSYDADGDFVYGGLFYKRIRTPDTLFDFAARNEGKIKISCYSNAWCRPDAHNITLFPLLEHDRFFGVCVDAKALIYIGNKDANSKSSKYLEYIAYHRPIVGLNVEPDNEVRKYPFYYDGENENTICEIDRINKDELLEYDPYETYPDRKPGILYDMFFGD